MEPLNGRQSPSQFNEEDEVNHRIGIRTRVYSQHFCERIAHTVAPAEYKKPPGCVRMQTPVRSKYKLWNPPHQVRVV